MGISVLILTLNEEINIADCLAGLRWSDDIVVFDSYSTDRTISIAQEHGCRVVQRKFDNWSSHQNWAVGNIQFKHPWVLYFDADERCPADLAREIESVAQQDSRYSAFRMRRKDFFMGQWLKHAQLYPTWITRLFRPEKIRYERLVNPVAVIDGECGALAGHIHHYPFSHGVSHWIDRHNRYSDMEAQEILKNRGEQLIRTVDFFDKDPHVRRKALKELFYQLPFRPAVKFVYYYLIRRGFLDGSAGLTYSTLQAIYEYFIVCKHKEFIRKNKGLPL